MSEFAASHGSLCMCVICRSRRGAAAASNTPKPTVVPVEQPSIAPATVKRVRKAATVTNSGSVTNKRAQRKGRAS